MPPDFHAEYGGSKAIISIKNLKILRGKLPNKQEKMVLGWAALRQDELMDNWKLAQNQQELFQIDPIKQEAEYEYSGIS